MELESLLEIFGGAGVTFYVMWLWLKSIQAEKKELQEKIEIIEEKRIVELREMLPLLIDASNGLQDVIKSNLKSNTELVSQLKKHIDISVNEISIKCKKV